ncbi:MAG: hypothetical protein E7587_03120 [Ruminococcaceae bacterium]|nr:hypothetical protein [Oscillospiraceae bacterium]
MNRSENENFKKAHTPIEYAQWIAPSLPVSVPVIEKIFKLKSNAEKAKLYITGLGYFEFLINGQKITDERLIPPASDYFRRDFSEVTYPVSDSFTHRIYYHVYDISTYLCEGENSLEITLGGGWLTQNERIAEGRMHYSDRPMCLFALNIDGTFILSDGSECWHESKIRRSRLFIGEEIDLTFSDDVKKPVITLKSPDSILSEATGIPDKIIRHIKPELISETADTKIYDVGENVSALVSLTTHAKYGESYTLRFAEYLSPENGLDFRSTGSPNIGTSGHEQIMSDLFVTDGKRRTFLPHFTWHAFRYFEVTGKLEDIEDITVCVIHSDVKVTSEFNSDSEGLGFLYDAYIRTQLSNYHGSFPSDCPHRERLGYTGDGQICARSAMIMLNSKELYRKWIRDILDCQDTESGHVQHTAPFQGGGGGPGGWGSAIVTVPYAFAKEFGYDDILNEALPNILRWIRFTEGCTENGLVVRESEGGWCLGDWFHLKEGALPPPFVNTCWFIYAIRKFRELAVFLGCQVDAHICELENTCLEALKKEYQALKEIGSAMVYAAWIGIDSPARAAEYYDKKGSFDTGFLGTDILCELLFDNGYVNTAYKLLSSESLGSFLHMKRNGATTIWERWKSDKCGSASHPMFGACSRQIFQSVLGIDQEKDSFGYSSPVISPKLPQKMNYAEGSVMTAEGKISVSLSRISPERIKADVVLPENLTALFRANGICESFSGEKSFTIDN